MTMWKQLTYTYAWRERNKKKYLSWWLRKRSKGKFHFVWTTTLSSALLLFAPVVLVDYFIDGTLPLQEWTFWIPFSMLAGLIISFVLWWTNEAKYKNARIDARIKFPER